MSLTPTQRTLRARLGAYAQQAKHDTRETTAAARQSFLARFEHDVDPDGVLPEDERRRRAEAARRAYFAALRLKQSKTTAKRIRRVS